MLHLSALSCHILCDVLVLLWKTHTVLIADVCLSTHWVDFTWHRSFAPFNGFLSRADEHSPLFAFAEPLAVIFSGTFQLIFDKGLDFSCSLIGMSRLTGTRNVVICQYLFFTLNLGIFFSRNSLSKVTLNLWFGTAGTIHVLLRA